VAIDQHFSQRGRNEDMQDVIDAHPELLGIGIDERTTIVVKDSVIEVSGENHVTVYEGRGPRVEGARPPRLVVLNAGDRYDLTLRKKLDVSPVRAEALPPKSGR
jgi:cyanophycinase